MDSSDRFADDRSSAELRVKALQMVPASHPKLKIELLGRLLAQDDTALRLEAVRTLAEHPDPRRTRLLLDAARNEALPEMVRAQAVLGALKSQSERSTSWAGVAMTCLPFW